MIKIIGFTGTQVGMTTAQKLKVTQIVRLIRPEAIHHGDCIGSDVEFHKIINEIESILSYEIKKIGHIPKIDDKRAFCIFNEERSPKSYLVRNHIIVDECDIMIGTPQTYKDVVRSGTWSTIRYAKNSNIPVFIVYPSGAHNLNRNVS